MVGALLFPAASVAVTLPTSPSPNGLGVILQLPAVSVVVVIVVPSANSTLIVDSGSAVPDKPDSLF
ncbi:hypothetical protein KPC_3835 [Acinetobacter stercoris]|nr:hypothetical protein KPC_3835 [Acinetobacter stercoris]